MPRWEPLDKATARRRRRGLALTPIDPPDPEPSGSSYILQTTGFKISLMSGDGFITRSEQE